jgi:hypothetical protein
MKQIPVGGRGDRQVKGDQHGTDILTAIIGAIKNKAMA